MKHWPLSFEECRKGIQKFVFFSFGSKFVNIRQKRKIKAKIIFCLILIQVEIISLAVFHKLNLEPRNSRESRLKKICIFMVIFYSTANNLVFEFTWTFYLQGKISTNIEWCVRDSINSIFIFEKLVIKLIN